MALKVKAVDKNIKFKKDDPGVWRYVLQPELYTSLSKDQGDRSLIFSIYG